MTKTAPGSCASGRPRSTALLHRLQQRALRLRRRAVDLVGQQHRVEDRAGVEAETARRSSYIAHPSVGRAGSLVNWMRARTAGRARRGQRLRERRLAHARDVLDQQVPRPIRQASASLQRLVLPTTTQPSSRARTSAQRAGPPGRSGRRDGRSWGSGGSRSRRLLAGQSASSPRRSRDIPSRPAGGRGAPSAGPPWGRVAPPPGRTAAYRLHHPASCSKHEMGAYHPECLTASRRSTTA